MNQLIKFDAISITTSDSGNRSINYTHNERQILCAWAINDKSVVVHVGVDGNGYIMLCVRTADYAKVSNKTLTIGYLYIELEV